MVALEGRFFLVFFFLPSFRRFMRHISNNNNARPGLADAEALPVAGVKKPIYQMTMLSEWRFLLLLFLPGSCCEI